MAATRAKFRCNSVETFSGVPTVARAYKFSAVYDDGIPENQRFAQYTPAGQLQIHVDNPAVRFELGKCYYLDITPAD